MVSAGTARTVCMAALVALPGLLAGCCYMYVAQDGSRHVIGFLHAVLPPEKSGTHPAESLRTQTLGFALTRADVGTSLTLGYSDITLAYVRENTCVRWPLSGSPERKIP